MNRRSAISLAVLALGICACASGCGERDDTGPPTLHLGDDVCQFCQMIISDQRFAAACIIKSDNRSTQAAFDDIGCLLEFEKSNHEGDITHRYVTDYDSGAWLDASTALYIQSPQIHSPMASGIIASQTQAGADRLAQRFAGPVLSFDALSEPTTTSGFPANLTGRANTMPQQNTGPERLEEAGKAPEVSQ